MLGPGKYDDLATYVREKANARAVILVVVQGERGSGFSVQAVGGDITATLPDILRTLADALEGDIRE